MHRKLQQPWNRYVCVLRATGLTERFGGYGARPEKYNSIKEMRNLISFSYLIQSQRRWPGFGSCQTDSGPHKYKPPHPPPIGLKERGTLRYKITVFVSVICKFIYSLKKILLVICRRPLLCEIVPCVRGLLKSGEPSSLRQAISGSG